MKVHVQLEIQGQVFASCLVDTGAGVSLIPSTHVRSRIEATNADLELHTLAGNVMPVLGKTTIECSLCGADGTPQWTGKHTFYVADIITGPILGADFFAEIPDGRPV